MRACASVGAMKTGFTSRVCPQWDLATIVAKAAELGFDGVELGALNGEAHLPAVEELKADPDAVKAAFAEKSIELVCLGTAETLTSADSAKRDRARRRILEVVELAGRLGCPFVRVPTGQVPPGDRRDGTLSRLAVAMESLALPAARHHVTLLVENVGDYSDSESLWFIVDHVAHPAVGACWNACAAMTRLERPTTSIPRLGRKIRLARICDGTFDDRGRFGGFKLPGEGDVGLGRMVDLLRGVVYGGYLMFDWPKAAMPELPEADEVLPKVRQRLREWIDTKAAPLTAYKGDKNAVQLAPKRG